MGHRKYICILFVYFVLFLLYFLFNRFIIFIFLDPRHITLTLDMSSSSLDARPKGRLSRLGFREETQNYAKRNRSQIFFFLLF